MTKVVEDLRDLQFLEIQGMDGRDYRLAPTGAGRQQANDRMQLSRYVGPVPVTLAAYSDVIRRQHANPRINLAALKAAFSDLVISDELLRELGPAAIAGGAMFLYGPPGTGKSSITERILRIYGDYVLVPYAVEVDSQIINVFDPVVHQPAARAADRHRPPLGPVPPPVPHRGRRARPRDARPAVPAGQRHLRGPGADAGQQRDPRDRRLRSPGQPHARGPAQPVDRPPRPPARPPHPRPRREVRHPVRRQDRASRPTSSPRPWATRRSSGASSRRC